MKLLMISGDRSILQGKKGAFWYTLEELSKHWERIDVICPRPAGVESGKWKEESVFSNVFFHPSSSGLWYQPWWILSKGKELIAEHHHDVMTVHEYPPFYNGLGARWLHGATGISYALEVHHIETRAFSRFCIPWTARKAAAVRVVNGTVRKELSGWGIPEGKIRIVPSFYLDAEALRSDSSIPKQHDVVFCARLVRGKNIATVLRTVSTLPDIRLLVIGDGPERSGSEAKAQRLGIAQRVTFTGWLPTREDVFTAVQSARVMVVASEEEGGPRSALEAMALGIPVITTRVGVMNEVIQDGANGIFTDGTVNDMAQKIAALLENPAMQERIGAEAKKILGKFERKTLVKAYAEFLQSLCAC